MKTMRFVSRDIRQGICRRWYIVILAVIFGYVRGGMSHTSLNLLLEQGIVNSKGTFLDYVMYAMYGMPVYVFDPKDFFEMPMYWFIFQMGIAYFTAYYAASDFKQNGKVLFVVAKTRGSWWISKCLWCILLVLLYYVSVYAGIGISAWANDAEMSLKITNEATLSWYGQMAADSSLVHIYMAVFILPITATIAISLIQMFLSFIISSVVSFAGVCGMYILSAYYTTCFLPGNFTIWIRSRYMDEMGVSPKYGILILIIMFLFSIIAGWQYIKGKDVL